MDYRTEKRVNDLITRSINEHLNSIPKQVIDVTPTNTTPVEAINTSSTNNITPVVVDNTTPVKNITINETRSDGSTLSAAMTGFDISKFIRRTTPQQQYPSSFIYPQQYQVESRIDPNNGPNQPINIVFPDNYNTLSQYEKGNIIYTITMNDNVPKVHDPFPDLTLTEKVAKLKSVIDFIPNFHTGTNAMGQIQINSLLTFVISSILKSKFSEYGTSCTAAEPHLTEVPVSKHATDPSDNVAFDMCFEAELKDGKNLLVILFNSIPTFDSKIRRWISNNITFRKEKKQ